MYKLHNNPEGQAIGVFLEKTFIPFDPANQDFVQYQKWLSEGNQPLPADEPNA
jgi:hypothetical protein